MASEFNHLAMAEDPSRSRNGEIVERRVTERGLEDRVASGATTASQEETNAPVALEAPHVHAEELTFTVISTTDGRPLAKRFWLNGTGALETETVATMVRGQATIERVKSLEEFAERLDRLVPHQAVLHGIPRTSPATVVTLREYEQMAQKGRREVITRTREDVQFASAPGCAMLDFDATGAPAALLDAVASPEKARALLIEAIPELATAPMLWRPSSSSYLYDGTREVQGLRGQRIYIPLTRASDIPAFGKLLYERLWLRGYGFVIVSASGQLLDRTLVDRSVWQPERLDFAAGPVTVPPLERRTPEAQIWNNDAPFLDVNKVTGLSAHDQRHIEAKQNTARAGQREAARARRDEWATERGKEIARSGRVDESEAIALAKEAVDGRILRPGFQVQTEEGEFVDVAELLAHPETWHEKRFRDPLEPSYRADHRIAWANLSPKRGHPYIHSHAHGGVRYELSASRQTIHIEDGASTQIVDQCRDILVAESEVYQYKDQITRVTDQGRLAPVEPEWLTDWIQRRADVVRSKKGAGSGRTDLPQRYAKTLLAKTGELGLPNLVAITHGPFMRPDGRVVDEPGYDAVTQVLYHSTSPNTSPVRRNLTLSEAEAALRVLFDPFAMFPFADDVDRGSVLALLLTAAVRPGIPIAPGGLIESHEAGSGKTLLAQSIANLTGVAAVPQALPQPEEEIRKGLFAAARAGLPSVFFDNVGRDHVVDSGALSMVLTSGTIADRVLGESQHATVPFRSLILLTGNNPRIAGDLNRRLLRVRIIPQVENPWLRRFPFDPRVWTEAGWLRMRVAALELILAALSASPAVNEGSGYPDWDLLVRRTVVWIARRVDIGMGFADPVQSLLVGYREDPERDRLRRLLAAIRVVFASEPVTVQDMMARIDAISASDPETDGKPEAISQLEEVFREIDRHRTNRAIGMYLGQQKGRIVDGMALISPGKRNGSALWAVQPSDNGHSPR